MKDIISPEFIDDAIDGANKMFTGVFRRPVSTELRLIGFEQEWFTAECQELLQYVTERRTVKQKKIDPYYLTLKIQMLKYGIFKNVNDQNYADAFGKSRQAINTARNKIDDELMVHNPQFIEALKSFAGVQ